MSIKVHITEMLARHIGSSSELTVEGAPHDLDGLLRELDGIHHGFRDSICDEAGRIRVYVNVFVNGENVTPNPDALSSKIFDGDEVYILASVAGGCR